MSSLDDSCFPFLYGSCLVRYCIQKQEVLIIYPFNLNYYKKGFWGFGVSDSAPAATIAGALLALQELAPERGIQLVGRPEVIRAGT
jgi:hypothetical protein